MNKQDIILRGYLIWWNFPSTKVANEEF